MQLGLKEWRRAREISQQQMADKLGVHVNTYQNWESNPADISIKNALTIASILCVNFNDIIFCAESLQNVEDV